MRERRALASALFLSGAGEVVDFLLPLFAGAAIGASPSTIGLLLAVELAVSLVVRPLAGSLADRFERRNLAALGALLYALACVGYSLAENLFVAYVAAGASGVGGALLWVSLRALVAERLAEDSSVFARLVAAEETGGWVIFVPAVFLISALDYRGVFLGLAACCLVGAVLLASAPRSPGPAAAIDDAARHGAGSPRLVRRLLPMLAAVTVTMVAEGAISLLLLLHLQREFALEPLQIAMVFLPGAIAMGALPPHLHQLVRRYGRTRMLALASVSSAGFAASLAWAPNPLIIAVCWVLAAVAWAVVIPIQQAVIAEASGHTHLGRGMGWFESAELCGALIGVLAAGIVYELGSWEIACLAFAAIILSGAVIIPAAVRKLGVPNHPHDPVPTTPEQSDGHALPEFPDRQDSADAPTDATRSTRDELLASIGTHTLVLAAALAVGHLFIDGAELARVFSLPQLPEGPITVGSVVDWFQDRLRGTEFVVSALRIWVLLWIAHIIESGWKLLRPASRS